MPGRQAHGRPVGGAPRTNGAGSGSGSSGNKGKGKKRSKANALDAFSIASKMYEDKPKMTARNRELDVPAEGPRRGQKHARDDDDDEDGDDDDDEDDDGEDGGRRPRKMRRGPNGRGEEGDDVEYGSDSSGNEWRVGGVGEDDDDSEIESDDAFGESDEERFDGFTFGGGKKDVDEDDDDDDDSSLGSDAIDIADALDMSMSEDDEPGAQQDEDSEDESGASESGSSDETSDTDDDDEDDVSESGLDAWVSKFSGVKDADKDDDVSTTTKSKINLKDLGLLTVKDPQLKKSVKLMGKEEKESAKKHKLEVPLARRQQARLDRGVAYEKTNETLDRWAETVKKNRRAEHLVFPLPQTETGLSRHDNTELQPLTNQTSGNELEQTIMAIMEESGLGPSAKKESEKAQGDGDTEEQTISRGEVKELWNKRRQEREAKSREEARAKRIKKIKSKAYHRVHRKQRERDELKEREIMAASGELDSEEEREARDRQRAVERMGARHRESKWAKMRKGHAAWDEDVRAGITDMARRDEELRRRIEGRPSKSNGDDDDEDDESDYSDDENEIDERKRLLRQLDEASKDDDSLPKSKLMSMAFMQKAEAAKKKANDEMIADIRRELASDDDEGGSASEPDDVGRRQFGQPGGSKKSAAATLKEQQRSKKAKEAKADGADLQEARDNISAAATNGRLSKGLSASAAPQYQNQDSSAGGAWSQPAEAGPSKRHRGKKSAAGSGADVLDFSLDAVAVAPAAAAPQAKSKPAAAAAAASSKSAKGNRKQQQQQQADDDEDEEETHLVQFREQELLDRAFGGLDVVADFEREKQEVAEEDDDKVVDSTLPGWGSWVGDGVSNREKKRHQGRFLAKKEGAKRKEDRRDAKLNNVIINEKRIRKSEKYMASQLPHVYESKLQYERSLRLPLGPEFQTKETFQEVTKPRLLMKQGIIAPMAKPTY
ncbi:hypothetical protein SLS62_004253 [Diatrype stigma]|uniref:Uncharacterized protein n=1 Tax=Diatrype stigma TaxID=117547 RepID=A0AAN9YTE3_9PEZI